MNRTLWDKPLWKCVVNSAISQDRSFSVLLYVSSRQVDNKLKFILKLNKNTLTTHGTRLNQNGTYSYADKACDDLWSVRYEQLIRMKQLLQLKKKNVFSCKTVIISMSSMWSFLINNQGFSHVVFPPLFFKLSCLIQNSSPLTHALFTVQSWSHVSYPRHAPELLSVGWHFSSQKDSKEQSLWP